MGTDLVLENRSTIYDDHESENMETTTAPNRPEQSQRPSYITHLDIKDKAISEHFSKTKKIVYCVTGVCIGIIAIITLTVVAVTKSHSTVDRDPEEQYRHWVCTLAGNNANKDECENVGCHYNETAEGTEDPEYPACFYPAQNFGYYVESIDSSGSLLLAWKNSPMHPTQLLKLSVTVKEYSNEILRVFIKDPTNRRYEVPIDIEPKIPADLSRKLFDVQMSEVGEKFWIHIVRKATNTIIFDTRNTTLIFLDQFLEITSRLPSNRLYGMAERGAPFARSMEYVVMPLFAHDNFPSPIGQGINLYSSQPFYMVVEHNGDAHGVMIYNSNAMEVYLTPEPSVTLRAIGGIFDMYFFLGPTPLSVTRQLTDVIGKPFFPPYWSMGFHLCRYGYKSTNDTKETFERNWDKGMPIDVQWQDIDYMDQKLIFTIDEVVYSGLKNFVIETVHSKGVKYVIIVDPAVGAKKGFQVYERGHFEDLFIKNSTGQELIGKVWPGNTVFPDFTNDKAQFWWANEMINFHSDLPYDGIWLDMNEPANFDSNGVHGSIYGCEKNEINEPPYKPNTAGDTMYFKTLCLDARQAWGIQRDLHNIYGLTETVATYNALKLKNDTKKPFIISRSTFLGSGRYGGHWLGDNESSWKHLRQSIIGILDFNLIGIPMTGADIGGFFKDTTEELAVRWHQLGAWYPFCRNHNGIDSINQDPASFGDEAFAKMKRAIEIRYELMPYWYTQFYHSHKTGEPIMRATFQNFPKDRELLKNSFDDKYTQFMIGSYLLIAPVTTENTSQTTVYLPPSTNWYKHYNGVYTNQPSGIQSVEVPQQELPYFIKGGAVIFMQMEGQTTTIRRKQPYKLVVFPDLNNRAAGTLYLDHDEENPQEYVVVEVEFSDNTITITAIVYNGFKMGDAEGSGQYSDLVILGIKNDIQSATLNEENFNDFRYEEESNELILDLQGASKLLTDSFVIKFE